MDNTIHINQVRKDLLSRLILWTIVLFTTLLFCQVWIEIGDLTIRTEDVLMLVLSCTMILSILITGKLRYNRNSLNLPLLLWAIVLLIGAGVTLISPLDSITKREALVNAIRIVLAISMFFIITKHPASASRKMKLTGGAILVFSLITTSVCLLQIGYWDGWLDVTLPSVLISPKEENIQRGREIFGLYIGDTGAHVWASMLSVQILLVWLIGNHSRIFLHKLAARIYLVLLLFILIRISVRNSILGLFISMVGIYLLTARSPTILIMRLIMVIVVLAVSLYLLFYMAPNSYFVQRILEAIPRLEANGLTVDPNSNIHGRLDYWNTSISLFVISPLYGTGFFSYAKLSGISIHAHNSYFQTLAELGLMGVVALIWLMVKVGLYLYRSRFLIESSTSTRLWWEFTAGSLILISFTAFFDVSFTLSSPFAIRMIILGVLVSIVQETGKHSSGVRSI